MNLEKYIIALDMKNIELDIRPHLWIRYENHIDEWKIKKWWIIYKDPLVKFI